PLQPRAAQCRSTNYLLRNRGFGYVHRRRGNPVLLGHWPTTDHWLVGWRYFPGSGITASRTHGLLLPRWCAGFDRIELYHDGRCWSSRARSKGKEAITMTEHNAEKPLLEMKGVKIAFSSSTGIVEAVRGVDMTIYPGQSVAIVGESGSGKSTTAMSILGLLPGNGKVTDGRIVFDGEDITKFSNKDYERIRGSHIGLVPQDPMSNLNPVWRIGTQIEESLKANHVVEGSKRKERVVQVL